MRKLPVLLMFVFSACIAIASPDDDNSRREASLASYAAQIDHPTARPALAGDVDKSRCNAAEFTWVRSPDVTICAKQCTHNRMCGPDERCRIIDDALLVDDEPAFIDDDMRAELDSISSRYGEFTVNAVCDPMYDVPLDALQPISVDDDQQDEPR